MVYGTARLYDARDAHRTVKSLQCETRGFGADSATKSPLYVLTAHARTVMTERGIREEWLARTLGTPEFLESDARDEVQPGIVIDFNGDNQVVGVEILGVKARIPLADLTQVQFEVS